MPDDHSEVVPLLPIPNRTVKRLSADDSAGSRVKVGHRQALTAQEPPTTHTGWGFLISCAQNQLPARYSAAAEHALRNVAQSPDDRPAPTDPIASRRFGRRRVVRV